MAYNPKWNVLNRIIDGDTRIAVIDDAPNSRALFEIDGSQVADFRSGGLQLATGARVNEFSTDGTLSGDLDTAIPTEKAVKAYVDSQISGAADKIWEGDSYVEVVDDGTAAGYVTIVTDGVEVAHFDSLASTQRIGKESAAGRVTVNDTSVSAHIGITEVLLANATVQRLGLSTDTYLQLQQGSNLITGIAGTAGVLSLSDTVQRVGLSTDSHIELGADSVTIDAGTTEVVNATPDTQQFGGADSYIYMDQTAGSAVVGANSVEAMTLDENGLQMFSAGATINEFSNDDTLADASATSLPTEYAVKTYVDSQIGGQSHKIFQGDSYIQVIDDGTAQAYAEVVINGTQVQYWDDAASSIRMGKASGAGQVTLTDTQADIAVGTSTIFDGATTGVVLGVTGETTLDLYSSGITQVATLDVGGTRVMYATNSGGQASFGTTTNAFNVDFTSNILSAEANNIEIFNATSTAQRLGVASDTFLSLDAGTNTVDLRANNVSVLNATDTTQRFGASGDTALTLNTSADTFTLSAGANTQVSGGLTTLTLGVGGDTTIALDQTIDQVAITAGGESQLLIETSGVSVYEDLTVTGNLYVDGTTWVVHNQEVTTSDNIITLNYGEVGPGVTDGTAGIEIDRGSLTDYRFVFDEASDTFRVGEIGALQPVATREDSPVSMAVPWWNGTAFQFQTAGSSSILVNTTTDVITFNAASSPVATFEADGLTLAAGTNISEFSVDGTLAGDSDDAVPTEKAVKTYVDAQIGGQANIIFQGDSYVQVVDDTTAAGYIEVVADGVQVQYWDAQAESIRMGKVAGGYVVVSDTEVSSYIGSTEVQALTESIQQMGTPGSSYVRVTQSSNLITAQAGSANVISVSDTTQRLGVSGDTYITMSQSGDTLQMYAAGTRYYYQGTDGVVVGTQNLTNMYAVTNAGANDVIFFEVNGTDVMELRTSGLSFDGGTNFVADQLVSTDTLDASATDTDIASAKLIYDFVQNEIANLNPDKIWKGDSYIQVFDGTAGGYAEVVIDGTQVQYWDDEAATIRMGKASGAGRVVINDTQVTAHVGTQQLLTLQNNFMRIGTVTDSRIEVDAGGDTVKLYGGNTLQLTASLTGITLNTGATVNSISTDSNLGSSDTTLITQAAAATYIDAGDATTLVSAQSYADSGDASTLSSAQSYADSGDTATLGSANAYTDQEITALRAELDLINVKYVYSDTTAVSGDVLLVDTTAGDVNIELLEADDAKVVIKKVTGDTNNVIVSTTPGTIDGKASITIDTKYQAYHFVSDSVNFFIL